MMVGTQLEAPQGWQSLSASGRYYFLASGTPKDTVRLLEFVEGASGYRAHLIPVQRGAFELALQSGAVRPCATQRRMPPWLPEISAAQYRDIDAQRPQTSGRYRDYVNHRYAQIAALVERAEDILRAEHPTQLINAHAASLTPSQNPARLQLWFFAYIAHGCNIWALMRANHAIGHWDRGAQPHAQKRFGRPGTRGKGSGFSAVPLRQRMVDYYLAHTGLGVTLKKLYTEMLRSEFGCKTRSVDGTKTVYQPDGLPYPTYSQFRYALSIEVGTHAMTQSKYGAAHMRQKVDPSRGRFTHELANLLEKVEVDAFYLDERPRSVLDAREMEPLAVARIACATSGAILGVGFSLGAETEEAYRMALFSAAIPKSTFCRLFGLTNITDDDWPAQGLPGALITDRGPGASSKVVHRLTQTFPMRQLAPSYQGQSKATVESSHPRKPNMLGAPTHKVSRMDVIALTRREIIRAVKDNHTSNIGDRLLGIKDGEQVIATPHHAWQFLERIGRTAAFPMDFDEAVRSFLTPVDLVLSGGELRLQRRVYDAPELRATGLYERVGVGQSVTLKGYCLALCVRHCWVEIDNQLIELTVKLPLRSAEERTYVSLTDLTAEARAYTEQQARQRDHALAAEIEYVNKFELETGLKFDDGKVVGGSARTRAKSGGTPESDALRARKVRRPKAA